MVFSPDGQRLAAVESNGAARLWDTEGKDLGLPQGHQGQVKSVAFSQDGQLLSATTTNDGIVRLWNDKGKPPIKLSGYQGSVSSVAIDPDGQHLAVGDSKGVWLGDTKGKKQLQLQEYRGETITSVVFSPDGQHLAVGGTSGMKDPISVWLGATTGQPLVKLPADDVNSMVFSRDSQRLVTGKMDGTIQFWNTTKDRQLDPLRGDQGAVMSVAFSPDGQRLAIVGTDGTTRLWSIKGQEIVKLQGHQGSVSSMAFSPKSQLLATNDSTDVRLYQIGRGLDELLAMNCDWVREYLNNPSAQLPAL
jgi:WD40 repeat protein